MTSNTTTGGDLRAPPELQRPVPVAEQGVVPHTPRSVDGLGIIAACTLGLSAFAIASVVGLANGQPARDSIGQALVAMAICTAVGRVIGWALRHATLEHIDQFVEQHPVPERIEDEARP